MYYSGVAYYEWMNPGAVGWISWSSLGGGGQGNNNKQQVA
jgi:hypothetical protein